LAESTEYGDDAPGQDSAAVTDHEQTEKPHSEPRPTDLGKAREEAKQVCLSVDTERLAALTVV
jgi:hypothetical protein